MPGGLTAKGTEALDQALARHVGEKNGLPGLVALVARGDDVHVAALGHKAFGDPEAYRPRRYLPHRVDQQADRRGGGHAAPPGRGDGPGRPR